MSTEAALPAARDAAALLWNGAGAAGATGRARRLRHRVRTLGSEHPSVYLPFARRKYPGPSPRVVGPDTAVVIDGYTRSASTFAVYAFQLAQREPVALAHHLHAAAQLIEAARRGLPTLVVIRRPHDAVLSQLVREPTVDLVDGLFAYRRFHTALMPYRDAFLVADFDEVTTDFGAVGRRLNARFGTSYGVFSGSPEDLALCTELIGHRPALDPVLLGFESGQTTLAEVRARLDATAARPADQLWAPSPRRDRAKAGLEGLWASPRLARARHRAEDSYRRFLGGDAR